MVDIKEFKAKPKLKKLSKLPIIIIAAIFFTLICAFLHIGESRESSSMSDILATTESTGESIQSSINAAEKIVGKRDDKIFTPSANIPKTNTSNTRLPGEKIDYSDEYDEIKKEKRRLRKLKQSIYESAINADTLVKIPAPQKNLSGTAYGMNTTTNSTFSQDGSQVIGDAITNALSGYKDQNMPIDQNHQDSKKAFLKEKAELGYLKSKREYPLSPYEIKAGEVLPAIMISGINSDLPGYITAQVSKNIYDTAKREHVLIPQGSKLVGRYDSYVAFGQNRALVAWHQLNFPDGSKLDLESMPGADQAGYAGFSDQLDNHYRKIFGGAFMLSLISASFRLSQPEASDDARDKVKNAFSEELGKNFSQVGSEMVRKNMNIQPTLKIRPGYKFNVFINKDIALQCPYPKK